MALTDSLVAPFKQREYVAAAAADVQYGMCVGFSADWVIRHRGYKSEGPAQRISYMKTQSPIRSEGAQRAYIARRDATKEQVVTTGQSGSIAAAFTALNSTITISSTKAAKYFHADRENALKEVFAHTAGVHNYYMIVLSFGQDMRSATDDNHVIAGYHSGGKFRGWGSHLYIFEPNHGEFKLSGKEVKGFFDGLAAAYLGYVDKSGVKVPKKLQMVNVHQLSMP